MKYLITESQLDNIIFKYLDNQDFVVVGDNISLFFVNSEEDEYSQIRFDEEDGWCGINEDLVNEISSFFSISYYDSEQVIGRWVENTLQMKVTTVMTGTFTNLGD
jgi:cupin superfamily acireductone dioxygenase involved in methionine salvage